MDRSLVQVSMAFRGRNKDSKSNLLSIFVLLYYPALKPVLQATRFPKYTYHCRLLQMMIICLESPGCSDEGPCAQGVLGGNLSGGFLCPGLNVAERANEIYIVIRENIPAAG